MKKLITTGLLATGLLLAAGGVQATVITFDNTAAPITDLASTYTESGFTIVGLDPVSNQTQMYALDPTFSPTSYPSQNGTDFLDFEAGSFSVNLSSATPFSLQSFDTSTFLNEPAGTLTLTGYLNGGGTLSQTFNTLGANTWSLFTLTGWNNLTGVDFVSSLNFAGLDNITVNNAPSAVPAPSAAMLIFSAFAGLGLLRKRKLSA